MRRRRGSGSASSDARRGKREQRARTAPTAEARSSYRPRERWVKAGTWTKQRVRAAILDWHRVFGRPPLSYEWVVPGRTGRGQRTPGQRLWRRHHPRWPSRATVLRHFGSWSAALEDAGLPVRSLVLELPFEERVWTAHELASEGVAVREIARRLGVKPATARGYLKAGSCRGCGVPVVQASTGLCRSCSQMPSKWTPTEIQDAIRRWTEAEGRPPTYDDWRPRNERWRAGLPGWPSASVVAAAFGSWNEALAAAGFEPRSRTWSADEIIAALRRWAREHGGRPPAYGQWRRAGRDHPGVTVVADRFGSWTKGVRAAGLTPARSRANRRDAVA